jgi:uncharacterized protein (TIGR01777 family)
MKILMTGSTGLLGRALTSALAGSGNQVAPVRRQPGAAPGEVLWDGFDSQLRAGADAVIHLAGENLTTGRWHAAKKQRIVASRVQGTTLLVQTILQNPPLPRVLLSASAIGIYGNRGDEILTEDSPPGSGFAADLCRRWEQATAPAAAAGIRVVSLRIGIVLSKSGGALAKMLLPFRLGLGGTLGNGSQFVSWITLDDAIAAMIHLLDRSQLSGPVNIVGLNSATNRQLTKALGKALHRPTIFPVPAALARIAFGEMADELLFASMRVVPQRLQNDGFRFQHPDVDEALAYELAKSA